MVERWKAVAGCGVSVANRYEVSDQGRVRRSVTAPKSSRIKRGKIMKPSVSNGGYSRVTMYDGSGRHYSRLVHRLTLLAFNGVGYSEEKRECNHISGDKNDNRVENLEWCSPKENTEHAVAIGLRTDMKGDRNGNSKLTIDEVVEIRSLCAEGVMQKVVAEKFNIRCGHVSNIVSRRAWSHVA